MQTIPNLALNISKYSIPNSIDIYKLTNAQNMLNTIAVITPQSLKDYDVMLNKIYYYIKINKLKSRIQKKGVMLY